MLNVSGPQLALLMIFAVAQAVLGYYLSEKDRRNLGRTPWGVPSIGWAAIWFLSLLLGLVLWVIAHRTEVRRAAQAPISTLGGPAPAAATSARATGSDFPAYPRPPDGRPRETPPPATRPVPPAPVGGPDAASGGSPPAWQPDPGGRFHYRWWSGSEWTAYVSIDGQVQVDSSPDQRIGPY